MKESLEIINFILTPLIAIIGTYVVYTSFQQQVKANEIQIKALKKEKMRYKADKDFDRIMGILTDLENLKDGLRIFIEKQGTKEEFRGSSSIEKYIGYLIDIQTWEETGKIGSRPNLPFPGDFAYPFYEYLQMVRITCKYLINFKKYDEDAFYILKPKFDKVIESLQSQLSRILHCKGGQYNFEFPSIKAQSQLTLGHINKLQEISKSGFRLAVNLTESLS